MKRFRKVLVLVDERPESTVGVERAVALAQRDGAELTVLRVLDELDDELQAWPVEEDRNELGRVIARKEEDWQRARLAPILGHRQDRIVVEWGKPCVAAIRLAASEGHDLVVKTARGKSGGRRVFFGTTAMHLFRKCPSPVWVVSPRPTNTRRVLAAINPGHPDDRHRHELGAKVLSLAEQLASRLHGELHVIHAWGVSDAALIERHLDETRFAELVKSTGANAGRNLARALSVLQGPADHVEIAHGRAEDAIPRYAADHQIDTIVMGSVGRHGIRGLLIGEMAEEILSRVDCGVLAVKPDGFESPLAITPARPAA